MHFYGWQPDLPDQRDLTFGFPEEYLAQPLPEKVDLRVACPPVVDQGNLGSCTANAIGNCVRFDEMRQGIDSRAPSRLFIYFNEREMEHTIGEDAGAMIRDGIKTINTFGVCPEQAWPYDIGKFTVKPPAQCYADARLMRSAQYRKVPKTRRGMQGCLATGFPFVFGFTVYESFENADVARTGNVPMPQTSEGVLGGHAVLCVGYDNARGVYIVQNSWGTGWGDGGFCYMPYGYLEGRLASDFWTIRLMAIGG